MTRTARWLAAIALAVIAALAGGPGASGAVQIAVWHLSAVYPENSVVDAIVAASPTDAWAAETCTRPCATGSDGLTLRHWNGQQWAAVADPAAFAHLNGGFPVLAMNPGQESTLWALHGSVAVRWTGRGWAAPVQLARNFQVSVAAAASSSDVWAIGQLASGQPYAERYNGKTWAPAPAPPISVGSISATSPTDVWAIGADEGGVPNSLTWPMVASHWTGTKWTTTKLPGYSLGDGSYLQSLSIVADGPHNAWAFGEVVGEAIPGNEDTGIELYRWNGATWSPVTVTYPDVQPSSSGMFSDGLGGIWYWGESPTGANDLIRDSAGGLWSEKPLPLPPAANTAQVDVIEPIPGSASLWAGGAAGVPARGANPGGIEGIILRYPT